MIKTVIFDFGQVLYRFVPRELAAKCASNDADAALLEEVVFDRLYWDRLDLGTIEDEELLTLGCKRLPERLHSAAREAYYGCFHNMPKVPGMKEVVARVKKTGVKLLLLSNISKYFVSIKEDFEELSLFDTCYFSAEIGLTKPDLKIYQYVLDREKINPEEALFIDDSEKNISGAAALGIKGYLFDGNAEALSEYLEKIV